MATRSTELSRHDRTTIKANRNEKPAEPPPAPQLLRLPAVREVTGLGITKIYSLVGAEQFPRPVVLARARNGQPRAVAWPAHEVFGWVRERIAERDIPSANHAQPRNRVGQKRPVRRDSSPTK